AGIPAAVGAGLSAKLRGTKTVAVAFFGDGAVNHGAFHESINFAAAQRLPVLFVCENNLYATATPFTLATRNCDVASRGAAYDVPGLAVDGNDLPAGWAAAREAVARARTGGGPTPTEARTYRTVGHHEGDPIAGTYRTLAELEEWKERCPIKRFKNYLLREGIAPPEKLLAIEEEVAAEIADAIEFAQSSPLPSPSSAESRVRAEPIHPPIDAPRSPEEASQSWLDAVRDGIAEE